jgi:serine/threonine-protein kinase
MSAPSSWDPVGQVIADRYEVVDVIARGGQGVVCRARDRKSGNDVAVKTLNDFTSSDPQVAERFKREQQVLVELEGTNAVKLLDTCATAEGALCLVMELLDGVDLEQFLEMLESQNKRMPLERIVEVLDPIVETLTRAHKAGIFHRDLKPANIFLLSERAGGGVRLLDFGFARLRSARPLTAIGTVMGSPSYIAPEVWKGQPHLIDQRTDVYSLAVITFRMLAGRPPFESSSLLEMLTFATSAERPSLHALRPDLPAEIDDWSSQALAVEPGDRFRTVRALYQSLLDVLGIARPEPKSAGGLVAAWRAAKGAVLRLAGAGKADKERSQPAAASAPPASSSDEVARAPTAKIMSIGGDSGSATGTPSAMPRLPPPPRRPPPRIPPPPAPEIAAAANTAPVSPAPAPAPVAPAPAPVAPAPAPVAPALVPAPEAPAPVASPSPSPSPAPVRAPEAKAAEPEPRAQPAKRAKTRTGKSGPKGNKPKGKRGKKKKKR